MKLNHVLLLLFALLISSSFACYGQLSGNNPMADIFGEQPDFLPVEQAFVFDYTQEGDRLTITFDIAEGYYLYKQQFRVATKDVELGEAQFPPGTEKDDEIYGITDVYYDQLTYHYPVKQAVQDGTVKIRYQGCAEAGLCYPFTTKVIYLSAVDASADLASANSSGNSLVQSEQFALADRLSNDENLLITLLLFVLLGIGLAFTPCVFPMYPILSSIVLGQRNTVSLKRAFLLSLVYVQGMALTYSLLGLVVASAGVQFQAALQHPFILGVFIILFAVLALAMFGVYELQLPSSWQSRLNALSNSQTRGSWAGVFVMGVLSGLVASPCTTAPLTGILLFIAQTGDSLLGFISLYMLSMGMGIPLILFAMTGGKLLPKAGNWMTLVKVTFGFMMLAVAIVFLERLWTHQWTNLLWALLGLGLFSYYYVHNSSTALTFGKGLRAMVIFVGLFASAMLGYNTLGTGSADNAGSSTPVGAHPPFTVVKDLRDFEEKLAKANAEGKTVMVDLYADWCVACKEFEKFTFPDPAVIDALSNTEWMQIDLTDNTATNLAFQQEFDILGLPTILFFNTRGEEIEGSRVTGFMRAQPFASHVTAALKEK